jgi:predicted ribosome quality control (RQC) complex YloA/Tae2 family protein
MFYNGVKSGLSQRKWTKEIECQGEYVDRKEQKLQKTEEDEDEEEEEAHNLYASLNIVRKI